MAIIGIDLGTTNSLACIYRDGRAELISNELGDYKTSSAVSVLEDGTVLIGAAAKERLVSHPESTAASFKIWMGTKKIITLSNRRFQPEELSALVLRQLMEDAGRYMGEPVEEAVISVPAYFNDDQRCATKLAAQLAGLTVKRLINEPSAAALSGSSKVVISLWQGEMQYSLVLTDELLRRLCEPIFQKVRTVITHAMKDQDQRGQINDVILVGGSSRLTVFGDFLEELFVRRPHCPNGLPLCPGPGGADG